MVSFERFKLRTLLHTQTCHGRDTLQTHANARKMVFLAQVARRVELATLKNRFIFNWLTHNMRMKSGFNRYVATIQWYFNVRVVCAFLFVGYRHHIIVTNERPLAVHMCVKQIFLTLNDFKHQFFFINFKLNIDIISAYQTNDSFNERSDFFYIFFSVSFSIEPFWVRHVELIAATKKDNICGFDCVHSIYLFWYAIL